MANVLLLELLIAFLVATVYTLTVPGRRNRSFPPGTLTFPTVSVHLLITRPGPPTLPLIGNLHQLPKSGAHFK